jgi:hypothetical protein
LPSVSIFLIVQLLHFAMNLHEDALIKPDASTSQRVKYPHWQRQFEAALLERDPRKLRQRIDAAEAAIFLRLQALADSLPEHGEKEAISDAIRALRLLQREKLGYPEWNGK